MLLPAPCSTRDARISIFACHFVARAHFWLLVTVKCSDIFLVNANCGTELWRAPIAIGRGSVQGPLELEMPAGPVGPAIQ